MQRKRWALFAALAVVAVLAVTVAPESYAAFMQPEVLLKATIAAGAAGWLMGDIQLVRSKELRAQRQSLVEENRKVLKRIDEEKDQARVKELEAEWDKRDNDIVVLDKQIDRAEKQERYEAQGKEPVRPSSAGRDLPDERTEEQVKAEAARYRRAYWANLAGFPIPDDDRGLLNRNFRTIRGNVIDLGKMGEARAMSTTIAAGGYGIPEGFVSDMQRNMLAFGGVRPVARIITTEKGNSLPWPTVDDTSNEASIVGEGSALTSPQDPTFGVVTLGSFMYRTLVLASLELLQDEAVNLEGYIMDAIAERFARGTNRHYTVGNGSTQPHGFIPASSSGVTAASATSVGYADLVDLEHSVDAAYRQGASWQMNDSTIKVIKKLVDGDQRPLWVSGVAVKEPNTILGYGYNYNNHMAAVAASNKSVAFGQFKKFAIRDVRDLLVVRANELHIGNGQIGFYAFFRTDAKLLDAGTDPIKHLTHPSPN